MQKKIESFRKKIVEFSKENKGTLFKVVCTNYCDEKSYHLRDGKLAVAETFNPEYDFAHNKVKERYLNQSGIYLAREITR